MLAFYSVECGLKSVVMIARGEKTSKNVAQQFSHNIRALLAEAKISAAELGLPSSASVQLPLVKQSSGSAISFSDLHTAWRYGVSLEQGGEAAATEVLDNLISALRKRLTT